MSTLTHFDRAEFGRRLALVRARMAERGVDLLVEADPANMYYLTGYDGWSFYVPQVVLVPVEDRAPLWIGRGVDLGGAKLTCWMGEDCLLSYPEVMVQHPAMHPMEFVAAEIERRGWAKARIGIANDCFYYTPRADDALKSSLPNARFVEVDLLVNWVRLVKSEAEIAKMREAGQITNRIFETFYRVVRPGVRQCDVAAEIRKAQTAGTPAFGGDYSASMPFLPIGEQTTASHLTWTDQVIAADETTYLECAAVRHRYHAPLARTVHLGKPPQGLLDVNKAVLEAMDAAFEQVRPGRTCHDVEAAWRAALARHGLKKESRIGYPIGIGYPPTWGERTASLRKDDTTVLEPNMCFHMILGMWMGDRGFETSESFRVTDEGYECFSTVPRGLRAID
ncbi:MAG: Xaa-Pro peptidase family protein [Alphaproteobacteria bacterium]